MEPIERNRPNGIAEIPGLLTLTAPLNYGYAVIGVIGLLLVISKPSRDEPTTIPQ